VPRRRERRRERLPQALPLRHHRLPKAP
jgi:hypothetical protein